MQTAEARLLVIGRCTSPIKLLYRVVKASYTYNTLGRTNTTVTDVLLPVNGRKPQLCLLPRFQWPQANDEWTQFISMLRKTNMEKDAVQTVLSAVSRVLCALLGL